MKRAIALILLLILTAAHARGEAIPPAHTVRYYYRNYCESCTPEEDFGREFEAVTGISLDDCAFSAWNVVRQDGQRALEQALSELGLEDVALPLAIVDGTPYQGSAEMNASLARTALSWQRTLDSEILFLYTPACESCADAEAALAALPDKVTLKRGEVRAESRVIVERVDISADPGLAQALFEAYDVPEQARVTPIVFYADRYLSGASRIEERLAQEVALGWASGGVPRPEPEAGTDVGTLFETVGAGLVAGLNTCALSMLLLFVSLILDSRRRVLGPVVGFLLAKLACYLIIGFALTGLMQRLDPHWLRPLARWLMTGLGAVLIVLNLLDAWHAARGDLGRIRNQLPTPLRGGIRRTIQRLTQSRALVPASVALGFIVAGGEFMCAGQLYLMQLMASARRANGQSLSLVLYCVAFTLPSALVCAGVLAGRSHVRAAGFFADHMAQIKLLTAIAMLGLIVMAWLI